MNNRIIKILFLIVVLTLNFSACNSEQPAEPEPVLTEESLESEATLTPTLTEIPPTETPLPPTEITCQ